MPALKLFGRKWLAASDDLVFPCIFEVIWRVIFSIFTSLALYRYWIFLYEVTIVDDNYFDGNFTYESNESMPFCHQYEVYFIKTYLIGVNAIMALNIPLLLVMISYSAKGSICDIRVRRAVTPLLYLKIFLILPELGFNVMGTIWAFFDVIKCVNENDNFANTSIEAFVIYYWIVLSLMIFAMIIAFDPLGARKYRRLRDANGNLNDHHEFMHKKVSKLWLRRFRLAFCCLTKDEYGDEAFTQTAELFSNLFNGTDLTPSDIIAGSVLMRVRQKKENREYQRNQLLNDNSCPRYFSDLNRVFNSQCASWMTLKNAQHFLRFAVSSYGWPLPCAVAPCRSCCGIMRKVTCCASLRNKSNHIVDDNCCNCNEAGARYSSRVHAEDIMYASFKNQVFEVPFCLIADHKTKSVVLSIRGSWSISDVFTDLAARPGEFTAFGFPENTFAHYGMIMCVNQILKNLESDNLLDKILAAHPEYQLVITGHSLGAGLSILVGAKLRSKYSDLKVFAFATPNGLLTREAAKYVEQFAFTIVIGDDCIARMSLDAVESLKIGVLETLQSCRLPKYRVILNSFAYALLGIPPADLESTWHDVGEISTQSNHSSTLLDPQIVATITNNTALMSGNTPRPKLCVAGKILHIVRKKSLDKKSSTTSYEMRWAAPEDFVELKVMPRMLLDHFPQNILGTLTKILKEQKRDSDLSVDQI